MPTDIADLDFERSSGGSVKYTLRFANTETEQIDQLTAVGFEEMVALAVAVTDDPHLTEVQVLRETHVTDVTYDIKEHLQ